MNKKEFFLTWFAGFVVGLVFGWVLAMALQVSASAQVTVTATVPITQDNCWTTYLTNKNCFDECIK